MIDGSSLHFVVLPFCKFSIQNIADLTIKPVHIFKEMPTTMVGKNVPLYQPLSAKLNVAIPATTKGSSAFTSTRASDLV